jgi:hypothetical protein
LHFGIGKPKTKPWLIGAAVAMALAASAFFAGVGPFAPHSAGNAGQQQVQSTLIPFEGHFGDYSYVNLSDPTEKAKALTSLHLPPDEAKKIVQSAEEGKCKLAWESCYDTGGSRGNVYEISSLGYTLRIPLKSDPTTFVIPVMVGGSIEVKAIDSSGTLRETRQVPESDLYNRTFTPIPAQGS